MSWQLLFLIIGIGSTSGFLFNRGEKPLPIDGGWTSWGGWSSCHLNGVNATDYFPRFRGFSVSSRPRSCDSPKPLLGGKPCQGSPFRYRQCGCKNPLGMQSGRISNSRLSASSGTYKDFHAAKGRLGHLSAWCSNENLSPFASIYYQIDFVNFTTITGLSTEGISEGRVSRYKLKHSFDRKEWTLYKDKYRRRAVFLANILPNTVKYNEIHEPFLTRYMRIYPIHSYNRVCMKIEVYGCPFTCGGQHTSSSGEIIGRSEELFDQSCLWKIDVKNTTALSLDFITFDVPCELGFVEIRDGSTPFLKSKKLRKICGQELSTELYRVPTNNLWIYFHSNSSSDEIGFRTRYISACNNNLQLKGFNNLMITTPNYPKEYFDNNHCTWIISADSGKIYLLFKDFDIEASVASDLKQCKNDFLSIETSEGNKFTQLVKYCNSNKPVLAPVPLLVNSRKVKIQFKSDNAIVGRGFSLEATTYDPRIGKPTPKLVTQLPSSAVSEDVLSNLTPQKKKNFVSEMPHTLKPSNGAAGTLDKVNRNGTRSARNNTDLGTKLLPKKNTESDWTVVTVAAFSCFVFVLIVFVTVLSIRKCASGRRWPGAKYQPTSVDKDYEIKPVKPKIVGQKSRRGKNANFAGEEAYCQVKSPAGSIAPVAEEDEPGDPEEETTTAAIVTHEVQLKRELRNSFIDMYSDGADLELNKNTDCLASEKNDNPSELSQEETVI